MLYQNDYISKLVERLSLRGSRAAQSLLGLANKALRDFMAKRLTSGAGEDGALLADPVFEPTFGWQESGQTMAELTVKRLLHERLAKAMAAPPAALANEPTDYSFPSGRRPFKHQIEAWEILANENPQSVVITSGTGSGKTECFLVPVLNDLARLIDKEKSTEGIRALFIYPLNALINSQQNRLDAWTHAFDGQIRHCLYTGALPDERRSADRVYKGQVIDRRSLRASPPQMVVTNATMLEYMLIRPEDKPLLDKSAGKLRWIILDEAHTHIGSQAAEMALLLRRVMLAFKVEPKNVRFVATSATFGNDEKTVDDLRNFLADMGGISPNQVHVVQGHRSVPELKQTIPGNEHINYDNVRSIDKNNEISEQRYRALASNPAARKIRDLFVPNGQTHPRSLTELASETKLSKPDVLKWLDLLSGTKDDNGNTYLPLRIHLFHNVISTIRVCVDKQCEEKTKNEDGQLLDTEDWPYGMVYFGERVRCDCGAPLFPLVSCNECNEIFLQATVTGDGTLIDESHAPVDEFTLDVELSDEGTQESVETSTQVLVTNRDVEHGTSELLDPTVSKLVSSSSASDSLLVPLQIFQSEGPECPCCRSKSNKRNLFRHARIGSPFTLSNAISTLLEFCPPDNQPLDKPFQGRKLISFTDSRQGTARIAIKLQQDSERNRIRGLVHQHLANQARLERFSNENENLSNERQKTLQLLEGLEQTNGLTPQLQKTLQELRACLDAPTLPPRCSWDSLVNHLQEIPIVQNDMLAYYRELAPNDFREGGSQNLAEMLLAREFYRRPKRANNLETLGLVQVCYPALERIASTPESWPKTAQPNDRTELESYKAYLKVLLDFFVRENTVINVRDGWQRLIGAKIRSKRLLGPPAPGLGRPDLPARHIRWPSVNQNREVQSRAVLLLCRAFSWDTNHHLDQINEILHTAWTDLTRTGLLTQAGESYFLTLNQLSFCIPDRVYFCPITRRFIDTPFMGLTPYTPQTQRGDYAQTTPVKLPQLPPELICEDADTRRLQVREWLDSQNEISSLRDEGLWSDIADLVLEGGSYFRTAEHSAQQPKAKLEQYETAFKNGKLNLLSCSTTMEMGVDIGGINAVAMNNVPPHPANYLQRAGRAGRRKEGRAVALTVCKNTPHDQGVFRNPKWPFETAMRMPHVSLLSADLVQRHINAWLLSYWLKEIALTENVRSLKTGVFFLDNNGEPSLANQFANWAGPVGQIGSTRETVRLALANITSRTALQGAPIAHLVNQAHKSLKEIRLEWLTEYGVFKKQIQNLEGENDAAFRALNAQLERLSGEYLLSELAARRFLPGYGFPTDIVSFDNENISAVQVQGKAKFREDNRGRFHQLPSRDRVTALREYAPGSQVVIDGLVYTSAGITLNWHAPASEIDINESQLIRQAWRCTHCGASGTKSKSTDLMMCSECGAEIKEGLGKNRLDYLVPSGFAVNFFEDPGTDITQLQYVPPELPWLSIPGNWVYMANPLIGKFRASDRASLFHFSRGAGQRDFAICLECGLTESMLAREDLDAPANEQHLPKVFRAHSQHKRLRGGRSRESDAICPGSHNSWKIKTNIALGHNSQTNAFELVLRKPTSQEYRSDRVAGYSIAVALREAIAQHLGVQSEELGCDCTSILIDGSAASSIRVFDSRSGGYATQAAEVLNDRQLWERVISRLNCDCTQACQKCLLSFDTRFEIDRLDRHKALEWVNDSWLELLSLPDELKVFGESSKPEIVTLGDAINRELVRDVQSKKICLYLAGDASDWDLALARGLRHQILHWQHAGHTVEIWIPEDCFTSLDADQKRWLFKLVNNEVSVRCYQTEPSLDPLVINAAVIGSSAKAWASDNLNLRTPDASWDLISAGARIVAGQPPDVQATRGIQSNDLTSENNASITVIEITDELNGSNTEFATRFWNHLADNSNGILSSLLDGTESVDEIIYTDRYVRNPLVVNLLAGVLLKLQNRQNSNVKRIKILGREYSKDDRRSGFLAWHDWSDHTARDSGIQQTLSFCGLQAEIISQPHVPHYRQLQLRLASGNTIVIQLDQGFSFWGNDRENRNLQGLRVDFSSERLGEEIMRRVECNVVSPPNDRTQVFVYTTEQE